MKRSSVTSTTPVQTITSTAPGFTGARCMKQRPYTKSVA
jgi:hypothetical protein